MESRGADRRRSNGGRERSAYTSLKKQSKEPVETEYVAVPRDLKGRLIGKEGCVIKDIIKSSGASISSPKDGDECFIVSGNTKQRACAKRLIFEKVQEIQQKMRADGPPCELVEVPSEYKGLVIGKGGDNLRNISTQTGAKVIRKQGDVYIVSGTEEQRQQAKVHIKIIIAGARLRGLENEFNKVCCYIDGWNLPTNCELKLTQVEQKDRMVLPGSHAQYRLKPSENYGLLESCSPSNDPSYLSNLMNDALESLRKIKLETRAKEYLKADMWCHFGTAIIRGPDEEEADEGEWTVDEAAKNFQRSTEGNFWRTAFKEGVNLDERFLEGSNCENTPEEYLDYVARYDLAFLTPYGHQIRFKVWVTKKNLSKKLEEIPIPFSDVKNILEEIRFKDDATRKRCRGWLVLPSRRYLQADILFPGCEFDCRLTIRGRADSALVTDYVPNEESRQALSRYLSHFALTDEDDLVLRQPEMDIPEGFHLIHNRCSKRCLYEMSPGFAVILSEESSWNSDKRTEESRKTTDLHLHCKEWDELLNSGDWEPEEIVQRIPEFFRFVQKVQSFVLREMRSKTDKE